MSYTKNRSSIPSVTQPVRSFLNLPFGNNDVQTHKVSKVVQGNQKQIYDVVSNVALYKEFVPFVEESYVEKKNGDTAIAGLRVGWKQYDEKFECKMTYKPYESVIAESLTLSLFTELHTQWTFKPRKTLHGESCNVELELKYRFKNPLYNAMSSMFSDQVTSIMIKAFETRLKKLSYQSKLKNHSS
ncbi:uncharacterized protein CANTADRAFT_89795 [Suhomyces tanzawaensis NRRL Y-17324]|uniref:Coenzyme Q-binding protein COQ10 START domain-containing protein n=1 Tax=Suhomyces tanzawaensis NRRL Y-17324 TaxID=984487 RepID=A0A1E4SL31_9ASCO|nr:uncharacterized protein CANTADRAFT_89795 [Suhomyces tanzawaensis NRRL Y-17324]ODV80221.1 hypothetical protein CANTADRAFT_89795 [Suhomyces tanzawaensis NRRL Y-17324]